MIIGETDERKPSGTQRERVILAQSCTLSPQTFGFRPRCRAINQTL
jgi:hypothetical protein